MMTGSIGALYDAMPKWAAAGALDRSDALVLADLVVGSRAKRIIEVGTAAGVSTAMMGLAARNAGHDIRIDSLDYRTKCFFDEGRDVGDAIEEMLGHQRDIRIHPGCTVSDLPDIMQGELADFVFVDGCHAAPHVAADVLGLLPHLRFGAIIVLDDIDLPLRPGFSHQNGPRDFFRTWRGQKWQDPRASDLGILRFADIDQALSDICASFEASWDEAPSETDLTRFAALFDRFRGKIGKRYASCRDRLGMVQIRTANLDRHSIVGVSPLVTRSILHPAVPPAVASIQWHGMAVSSPRSIRFVARSDDVSPSNPGAVITVECGGSGFVKEVIADAPPHEYVFIDIALPPTDQLSVRIDGRSKSRSNHFSRIAIEPFILSYDRHRPNS